jgi:hypothetical protein
MNDLVPQQQQDDPFKRAVAAPGGNIGALTIESERAIAEVQGQLVLAKRFPRSMTAALVDFLDACKSADFAATAFYAVPNRGNGPSIRFAEEAARCYGNFDYGHRELGRTEHGPNGPGKSEIEVYAWDKEKNNRSTRQITVLHIRDKTGGATPLRDQTDIDNRIANVASKQMRGRILALVPKAMVAAGIAECKRTLAGGNEKPLSERIIGLCKGFANYGISTERLAKHLGHAVDDMTTDEFTDLVGIGNALKDGGKPSEYFPADGVVDGDNSGAQAITAAAAASKKATPALQSTAAAKPAARAAKPASKPDESAGNLVKDAAPAELKKEVEPVKEPRPDSEPTSAPEAGSEGEEDPDVF